MNRHSAVRFGEVPQRPEPSGRVVRLGSRLLLDAWSSDGQLLLRSGANVQTESMLDRLSRPDVRFGPDRSTELPLDLANEAVLDAMQLLERRERAAELRNEAVQEVRDVFERIQTVGEIDVPLAETAAAKLATSLLDDARAMLSLVQIKDADAYTFTHSVNVGILAMYLALHTEYHSDLEEVAVGALLHDIGKVDTPTDILCKPGPLTEAEMAVMRRHPARGAEMLRDHGEKRHTVVSCVLSHHEKADGRGYPERRSGPQIRPHATITAIADIFDALTTNRPYRAAFNPRDALDLMVSRMNRELDHTLLACFSSIMGSYPVGSEVVLSDGSVGTVVNHYATTPDRPSVLVTTDTSGHKTSAPRLVHLAENTELSVRRFSQASRKGAVDDTEVEQMRLAA